MDVQIKSEIGAGVAPGVGGAAITKDEEYGRLAQDYRRLSELAVTAQEHADLKLGEIHMGLRQLRDQLADVQKILKDVE